MHGCRRHRSLRSHPEQNCIFVGSLKQCVGEATLQGSAEQYFTGSRPLHIRAPRKTKQIVPARPQTVCVRSAPLRFTKYCACYDICILRFTKVRRLLRNLRFEVHKVLRLPRNLHFEVHKVLGLPRSLHIEVHKVLWPATISAL